MKHFPTERIFVTGSWVTQTALHAGGDPDDTGSSADMALLRDSEGGFFIPGSSIAGVLRNFLARHLLDAGDYSGGLEKEPPAMKALFGGRYQSLLTVFDAPCVNSAGAAVRDGVAIDAKTGTAMDQRKFNYEVLPSGAQFKMTFLLTLYDELPEAASKDHILSEFRAALEALGQAEIGVGARSRKGLGQGTVSNQGWEVRRLDMSNPKHFGAWLTRTWESELNPQGIEALSADRLGSSKRRQLRIRADFRVGTSILIRSAGSVSGDPDFVHLTDGTQRKPIVSGSSVAGALRSRLVRIANTVCPEYTDTLVLAMYGEDLSKSAGNAPPDPDERQERKSFAGGRVWVNEAPLEAGDLMVQGRTSIDRFTQGTVDGALWDEAAFWPDGGGGANWRCEIRFDLDDFRTQENAAKYTELGTALLLQAFKDLWLGDLPIGGEVGVGRGVMRGISATISHPDAKELKFRRAANATANGGEIQIETGDWEAWNKLVTPPVVSVANGGQTGGNSDPLEALTVEAIKNAVPNEKSALVLVQGWDASGFGYVSNGTVTFRLTPEVEFNPDRCWDVRVFGEWGEWHAWRKPDRTWGCRKADPSCKPWTQAIDREYPLWGTRIKFDQRWFRLEEERGATLFLPASLVQIESENQLPVRLKAKLRVEPDDAGVYGVVDAMLCGWEFGGTKK